MSKPGHSPDLLKAIAEVLGELAMEVETLGATLCADPQMVANHMDQLQGIDVAAQTASHLAAVLNSDHPEDALDDIRLEALRHRLMAFAQAEGSDAGRQAA